MRKTYKNILTVITAATVFAIPALTGCGSGADIGQEKASQIAFEDAGVSEADVTRLRVTKDMDDGKNLYEVQFTNGDKEYEYEILASDGSIRSADFETLNGQQPVVDTTVQETPAAEEAAPSKENSNEATNKEVAVSLEEASKLALDRVPGSTEKDLRIKLELDDGYYKYEGDIIYKQKEYEFEIDANSGTFLEWSEERYDR